MSLIFKDRIKETTTTTGTGALTLLGAVTNFRSFADVGDNNVCYYCIEDTTNNVWEVGAGTYTTSGTILTRTKVFNNSSGTSSALNLSAGTKNVYLSAIAGSYLSETAIKSAAYTAVPGETILVSPNAAAGNFAITFPSSPYNGCHFAALVVAEHATRKVTFDLNGGSFAGSIDNYDLLLNGDYIEFQYNSDLAKWYVKKDLIQPQQGKMYATGLQTFTSGASNKLTFDSVEYDIGGIMDAGSNDYILLRRACKGIVILNGSAFTDGSFTTIYFFLVKNGDTAQPIVVDDLVTNVTGKISNLSIIKAFNSGDYIHSYLYCTVSSGTPISSVGNEGERAKFLFLEIRPR